MSKNHVGYMEDRTIFFDFILQVHKFSRTKITEVLKNNSWIEFFLKYNFKKFKGVHTSETIWTKWLLRTLWIDLWFLPCGWMLHRWILRAGRVWHDVVYGTRTATWWIQFKGRCMGNRLHFLWTVDVQFLVLGSRAIWQRLHRLWFREARSHGHAWFHKVVEHV